MAAVTFDRRSFMIDGKRLWLVSGAVHYFRMPAALWQDRLTKAMRGGLNCIETYIPWNYHEPAEGKWYFSGDHDLVEFIQQAGDMGLLVIVRPGPYIGGEWDFGGLPAWLTAKPNIQYRTNNATYIHYFDKYLRQVLPRIVPLQVSRGGNVIAIGNENDYFMTTLPDRQEYLDFITQLYRRSGIEIPILTCNQLTQPLVADAIECINTWDSGVSQARKLRVLQSEAPIVATELRTGRFDVWGREHQPVQPREIARRALELLGAGAQINYYPYHGGTNLGFWAGRTIGSDHHFATTSYDYDAPIAEGGALRRSYYLLRLVNVMAQYMADCLSQAEPVASAVPLEHTATLSRRGAAGRVAVVTNNGDDAIQSVNVSLEDGRVLNLDLRHFGAVAVFSDVPLSERHVLDYSNLMPLCLLGDVLVLHGVAEQQGVVSIDGEEVAVEVPADDTALHLEHQGLHLIIMNSSAAERCWPLEGRMMVGPAFVGETLDDVVMDAAVKRCYTINPQGQIAAAKALPKAARQPRVPTLGTFKRVAICQEVVSAAGFEPMDRPRPLAQVGVDRGYGWYRVKIKSARAATRQIFLPSCEDRATVFVNGKLSGVWGRGADAQRSPLPVALKAGDNDVVFLVDNLGRYSNGFNLGEPKGIWGDVYTAVGVRPGPWKVRAGKPKEFSKRIIPRNQQCLATMLVGEPWVAETTFTLAKPMPVEVQFTGLVSSLALLFNERQMGFFPAMHCGDGEVLLTSEARKGVNRLRLLVLGELDQRHLGAAVRLYRLEENLTEKARWQFRPWTTTGAAEAAVVVPRGAPAWFRAAFTAHGDEEGLFVKLAGADKGQLFLNGHNLGRFWSIGPQHYYYLPPCWLEERNELLIFSETGAAPTGSKLELRPHGAFQH
jgi:beta-galactosidase